MKIRRWIVSCVIALLSPFHSNSQIYLNEVFSEIKCTGILIDGSNYLVNGWLVSPDTVNNIGVHRDFVIYRLSPSGLKLDSLKIGNDKGAGVGVFSGSLKRLANQDLLQLGFISNQDGDTNAAGIVYRIHSDLSDTVWMSYFQYNNSYVSINLDAIEMGNGNIAVVGQYFHSYSPTLYEYIVRGWLYMLDSLGNRLWEKSFNFPTSNAGGSLREIKRAHDGGFIIGGLSSAGRTHPAIPNWNSGDGWVIKTDSLGNEQWRHKMTTGSQWYDSEPIIVPTSDGNYVVGQVQKFQNWNGLSTSEKSMMHFMKLNAQGNIIWERYYGDSIVMYFPNGEAHYHAYFTPVEGFQESDGSIVFAGRNTHKSMIFKLSNTGDSLWFRKVPSREYNFPNDSVSSRFYETERIEDFKLLPNGGFICAGQYQADPGGVTYPNGAQLNWIVQLDQWGCDSLGCQYISLPEPPQPQAGSYALRIWPNPATNHLHIELPPHHTGLLITIRNSLGQSVHQSFYNSSQPIDISHLAPGHYIVESGLPGEMFGYAKLVRL